MRGLIAEEGNLAVVDFGGSVENDLTKKQLEAELGKSKRWIENKVRDGMPSRLDGNRRMFRLTDVRAWLESRGREARSA